MGLLRLVLLGLGLPGSTVLGGSWDLVSKDISTLIGVISIVALIITLVTESHDPLSRVPDPEVFPELQRFLARPYLKVPKSIFVRFRGFALLGLKDLKWAYHDDESM